MNKRLAWGTAVAVFCVAFAVVLAGCGGTGSPANGNDGSITLGVAHGADLAEWLSWLRDNAQDNTTYILPVPAGNSYFSSAQELPEGNGIIIDIRPVAPANIIQTEGAAMFVVHSGATLRLNQDITLDGGGITSTGVVVLDGGTIVMESRATITGFGWAVFLPEGMGGMFTMRGGTISGNRTGVRLHWGTFTMQGGIITQNQLEGVDVGAGTFIMQGGTISRNSIGVYVGALASVGGTFRISGGIIHGNSGPYENTEGALQIFLGGNFNPPVTARWGSGNIWQDIETPDTVTTQGFQSPGRRKAIDMRTGVLQP